MKILFITSTRIGDAVLSTGVLNHLVQTHKDAQITLVCGPLPASLFEGFPNISKVIPLKKQKHHGHWIDLWKQTIGTKWDIVVDFRDSAVSRLIRADKRYIFGAKIDKSRHKVEQAAQMMNLSHVPSPKMYFSPAQNQFAEDILSGFEGQKIIAVGPTANWIGKTWEPEKFIEVINWLISSDGPFANASVAVLAAPGEEGQAKPVYDSLPMDKRIDVIAKGNPGQVAALIAKCDFYLGNDSGLMHIAAASGVPTVGVFGPSYPHLYAPWGEHTAFARTPETFDELIDFEGYSAHTLKGTLMKSLTTEAVIEKIKTLPL